MDCTGRKLFGNIYAADLEQVKCSERPTRVTNAPSQQHGPQHLIWSPWTRLGEGTLPSGTVDRGELRALPRSVGGMGERGGFMGEGAAAWGAWGATTVAGTAAGGPFGGSRATGLGGGGAKQKKKTRRRRQNLFESAR